MTQSLERFLKAIGYPDKVDSDGASAALLVDGAVVSCEDRGDRLVLSFDLGEEASGAALPRFAQYAAGRILKEDAVLAFGRLGARETCFLWQDAPADAAPGELLHFFESFLNSCDWWRERCGGHAESSEDLPLSPDKTMMIRP
jgi:hypothetical protein